MTKESSSAESSSKMTKYITAPLRALRCARDFYVKSMMGIAKGQSASIMAMSYGSHGMGRSRNISSIDDDINELIRAASVAKLRAIPIKSHSVATMRIDEDRECNFDGDLGVGLGVSRSKSCTATHGWCEKNLQLRDRRPIAALHTVPSL